MKRERKPNGISVGSVVKGPWPLKPWGLIEAKVLAVGGGNKVYLRPKANPSFPDTSMIVLPVDEFEREWRLVA